ncbi:hypothetical protein Ddc_23072 [Ditylenchus destructor]|nr:hypothetical protein Ddc_23072 [Ditylenchus destructor]
MNRDPQIQTAPCCVQQPGRGRPALLIPQPRGAAMNTKSPRSMSWLTLLVPVAPVVLLGACAMSGNSGGTAQAPFSQAGLPAAVQVPDGHKVVMETVGVGRITYECRAKKDAAGQFEWVFVGPDATLMDRQRQTVGKYYGPPATWESRDGSKLTGTQVAVAPAMAAAFRFNWSRPTRPWAPAPCRASATSSVSPRKAVSRRKRRATPRA